MYSIIVDCLTNIFVSFLNSSICFIYGPQMIFHHKYSDNTTEFYPQDFHFKDIFTGQVCYSIGMYLLTNPLNIRQILLHK